MIQIIEFESGGFVAHKIRINGSVRRFSAWFDKSGKLTDCEGFDSRHRPGPVSPNQRIVIERNYAISAKIEQIKALT